MKRPLQIGHSKHILNISRLNCLVSVVGVRCQWLTPFVAGVVSFLLVGIENIGIQIEQPFSVLPLDNFSRIIEADTMEQLQVIPEHPSLMEPRTQPPPPPLSSPPTARRRRRRALPLPSARACNNAARLRCFAFMIKAMVRL